MSEDDVFSLSAEQFSGKVRLFPLPNLVLFPNVMQPLQIFEPRYLEMLDDALADDRLLAIVLLQPGWELAYAGRPPIATTVCVGRIVSHQPLDDGRQNILLVGLRRAHLVGELAPHRPYREATVELLDDEYAPQSSATRTRLQRNLTALLEELAPTEFGKLHLLGDKASGHVGLGMLTDLLTFLLPLDLGFKQSLLAETNVDRRAQKLIRQLKTSVDDGGPGGGRRDFPPKFSLN
jgi:ATP-dependent Lon protease